MPRVVIYGIVLAIEFRVVPLTKGSPRTESIRRTPIRDCGSVGKGLGLTFLVKQPRTGKDVRAAGCLFNSLAKSFTEATWQYARRRTFASCPICWKRLSSEICRGMVGRAWFLAPFTAVPEGAHSCHPCV